MNLILHMWKLSYREDKEKSDVLTAFKWWSSYSSHDSVSRSLASNSAIPWTVAHQAPLSMEFSRQEYWNG